MKALLTAVKTQLQADLTYVRDADIFITEDERLIPSAVKFPAVGIKDGAVTYRRATKSQEDQGLQVKIIAYQELRKPEASIMGDTTATQKGILDMADDIIASLKNELFFGEVDDAFPVGESESELLADEHTAIVMKVVTMQYFRY
jgi:hypothetical protein